jgi:large conductance mechanosensitive channel
MSFHFLKDFREFICRGNMVDLAIGFSIGTAFGQIVNALVNDIMMPPISLLLRGIRFKNLFVSLDGKHYDSLEAAHRAGAETINYGHCVSVTIEFLIVILSIFVVVKIFNTVRHNAAISLPEPLTQSEILLTEIRDALRNK